MSYHIRSGPQRLLQWLVSTLVVACQALPAGPDSESVPADPWFAPPTSQGRIAFVSERDGNRAGHGGQRLRQFSDRFRKVNHGRVQRSPSSPALSGSKNASSHLKGRHDRPSATPHAGIPVELVIGRKLRQ